MESFLLVRSMNVFRKCVCMTLTGEADIKLSVWPDGGAANPSNIL